MSSSVKARSLFDLSIVSQAVVDSFRKLTPRRQVRNPVMFVVYVGSILTTLLWVQALVGRGEAPAWFIFWVSVWLWFTVLFANFAEAMAEGRGKAQAASLRKARRDLQAKRLARPERGARYETVPASALRKGNVVLVEAGDFVPADGEVIEGVASVNEAAITGESAPVIRESGGDRSSVTGGTQVLSDWLIVKVTANPGEAFLDRMISLVEGAKRLKAPNEIALDILLAALTIIFLLATATLLPFSLYSVQAAGQGTPVTVTVLVALLVCLIPTTIGALLSAIGIAGMDRMIQKNVIAMSGRAVEAAGDVDVLLLDKTGTITLGNRQATEFVPAPGVSDRDLADAAQLASLADETPEGRSIVVLAKEKYSIRERDVEKLGATFVAFSAQTRMSGVNLNGRQARKGAADGGRHRRRGGDRRLPGRGHAGGQAGAHPQDAGGGAPGGDDRRRHQRRAGPGPGRRGGGHELRHPGRQGSRQHDRSRLEPDQAAGGRRDRQADADDARRADHVQHRQRRRQVLRHHPGRLRDDVSVAGDAERHAPGHAGERDPLGRDLQRAHHHRADPAGAEGRALPRHRRRCRPPPPRVDLRRRRHHHSVPRHQARRH